MEREVFTPFDAGPRFTVLRTLGEGGMGIIYEAIDRERGRRVALKTLRYREPDSLLRFKTEYRSLQTIVHPNLANIGELHEAPSGHPFFTMELIEGETFIRHVRPSALDESLLRPALIQLVQGLMALHRAGKVHRDIKPGNVLVSTSGRVVILDFGLITDAGRGEGPNVMVGTLNYMSPEQAFGEPPGPASDFYSVGVMLYRALSGTLPFDLRGAETRADHVERRSYLVTPSVRDPSTPADLEALCVSLLDVDPSRRPSGEEILERLGVVAEPPPSLGPRSRRYPTLIGRDEELAALYAALDRSQRAATVMVVEGASGLGKSTLVQRFVERVPAGVTVLTSRCYERAAMPFNGVDELMDSATALLLGMPAHDARALLPANVDRLFQVFPVLKLAAQDQRIKLPRLPASLADTLVPGSAIHEDQAQDLAPDRLERRALLLGAARELVHNLAQRGPLVIAIDDVQWADADSGAIFAEILRAPAPPIFVVMTLRSGQKARDTLKSRLGAPIEWLSIEPMSEDDGAALACSIAERAGGVAFDARGLARVSAGHPLLLDALVRHSLTGGGATLDIDEALWARVTSLDPRARAMLLPVLLASGPAYLDVIERASGIEGEDAVRALSILRVEHLIRVSGRGREVRVEPYHDRLREAVIPRLGEAPRREGNRRLAEALEQAGVGRPDELAMVWHAAGDPARAAISAERAGDLALASFSFEAAARMFRFGLDRTGIAAERRLAEKLGRALSDAGRGREAAEAFLRASRTGSATNSLENERRAAESLLLSGYVIRGIAVLERVARAAGVDVPKGPTQTAIALLREQIRFRLRGLAFTPSAREIDEATQRRIDLCWSASGALAGIDIPLGAYFQHVGARLALGSGDTMRASRALSMMASFTAAMSSFRDAQRIERKAEELRANVECDRLRALAHFSWGVALFSGGRFRAAVASLKRAEEALAGCADVVFERVTLVHTLQWSLWHAGDLDEFARRMPAALRGAEERGNRFAHADLRLSACNTYWLYHRDDPAEAERQARDAMSAWPRRDAFEMQHLLELLADMYIALYRGDGEAAHRRMLRARIPLWISQMERVHLVRIDTLILRANAAISSARGGFGLLLAERMVATLTTEEQTWARGVGACLMGIARAKRGDLDRARSLLEVGVARCDLDGVKAYAMTARHRLGELLGGDEGAKEREAAVAWWRAQGAVDPLRSMATLLPAIEP